MLAVGFTGGDRWWMSGRWQVMNGVTMYSAWTPAFGGKYGG